MRIRTVLVAGLAGGIAYVLGTKAGRSRYEELKVQADKLRLQVDRLANNPQVRETVATVADKVKETAEKLPDPVAELVAKVTGSGAGTGAASAAGGTTPEPAAPGPGSIPQPPEPAPGDVTPPPVGFPTTTEATKIGDDTDDTGPVEPGIRPGV